ncbi:MAG: DUF61 family protein [Oscillospiraceae bacterium]|nr:DUF61 family protein [Oscillospiraceae bacterium]
MAVNNNDEINKLFGTEDEPVLPPPDPELKTSPLGDASTPGESPFQSVTDEGMKVPSHIDFSEAAGDNAGGSDAQIGDHSNFGFSRYHSPRANLKVILILLPIMLAIGAVLGGFIVKNYFYGTDISSEHSLMTDAVNAVYERVMKSAPEKVIFTDTFVNNKKTECEIIVFTVIEQSRAEFRAVAFRVVADKDVNSLDIFYEFDKEEYERLIESGDDGDLIKAQIMLNLDAEFERGLAEIRGGKWVNVDPSYINAKINNKKVK